MPQESYLTYGVLLNNSVTPRIEFEMFSPGLVNRYVRYQLMYTGSIQLFAHSLY